MAQCSGGWRRVLISTFATGLVLGIGVLGCGSPATDTPVAAPVAQPAEPAGDSADAATVASPEAAGPVALPAAEAAALPIGEPVSAADVIQTGGAAESAASAEVAASPAAVAESTPQPGPPEAVPSDGSTAAAPSVDSGPEVAAPAMIASELAAASTAAPAEFSPTAPAGAGQSPPGAALAAQPEANPLREGQESDEAPAARPKRPSKKDAPFDPIKENGEIFEKWPQAKPKLALVVTGRQDGYLEPCGCAGLNRMKGGLSRRHSMFKHLREQRGWPVIGLDAGGQIKGYGLQTEMKFHTTVEAMRTMGYHAVALGANDLRLPAAEVASDAAPLPDQPALFLSANAALFGFSAEMTAKSEIYEVGGVKVGVTSVVGSKWQKDVNNSEVEFVDPRAALAEIVPQLKAKAEVLVLLAHATIEESTELAKAFPDFHLVVTAGGPPEPPLAPTRVGKTLLVETGEKGMYAVVLGLYDEPSPHFEYERVPLDSRFPSSPDMHLLMVNYQDRLRETGLEGLGIHPSPHPEKVTKGAFVGSQACQSCHEPSYKIWKKTGHAKAWPTLVNLDPPRNYDPECISCHVIGWHPTSYFPYETGFLSEAETPKLIDVGCESCHGPGEKHCKAEEYPTPDDVREQLRKAMVITKEESEKQQCMSCHDGDNSPDFDFKTYWPFVEHYED